MRLPVEILVVVCLARRHRPGADHRPLPAHAPRSRCSAPDTPDYSLAVWHGVNVPLVMSVVALAGGHRALLRCSRGCIARGAGGAAAAPRAEGPAHLRAPAGHRLLELGAARSTACSAPSGCSRSCASSCSSRFGAGRLDALGRRAAAAGRRRRASTRSSRCSGLVGAACAVGAAWQAKYHRFAALVLLGGAGLVTCVTFVWLSAPDLAVTQLLVEIVTTVLLLLGLRWLPKRPRGDRRRRGAAGARCAAARDLVIAVACGVGIAGDRLRGDDRAARPRASPTGSSRTPTPRAAAPTSSTSSWSTSAASTPSARSPCSASSR